LGSSRSFKAEELEKELNKLAGEGFGLKASFVVRRREEGEMREEVVLVLER
jgi:hypothetical protein